MTAKGYKVSFWDEENILKSLMAMDAQLCEYTKSNKLWFLNRKKKFSIRRIVNSFFLQFIEVYFHKIITNSFEKFHSALQSIVDNGKYSSSFFHI